MARLLTAIPVLLLLIAVGLTQTQAQTQQPSASLDANAIAEAAGTEATTTEDGVVRIGWQRDDVQVTVDGMPLKPPAGLGSWAAFKATPHGTMIMGDTVVFEDEITPAMDAAFEHGLEVTALHNHFVFDRPPVFFMHIGGMGDAEQLSEGIKAVWDAIKAVRAEHPQPQNRFPGETPDHTGEFNVEALEQVFDSHASVNNGVVKFTFSRTGRMHGVEIGGSMGLSTWAAFSGSDELAAVDGDFIMTADEVQPVMHALREAGIHVVALHNHMIGGEPMFYFLHYWGKGPAEELSRGVRGALEAQQKAAARDDS